MINWMYTLGIAFFIFGFRWPMFYTIAGSWFSGIAIAQWQICREEKKE